MPPVSRPFVSLVLALTLVIAACSGDGGTSAAPPADAPSAAAATETAPPAGGYERPTAESEAPAAGTTLALAESGLGSILVDAAGMTLYAFTNDADGVSTCYDDCATNWPPLLATGDPTLGAGLDATKVTAVDRTDGTTQVKYGDWPLYYFAADTQAGDTNGQGVGDVWFVLGADGALIGQ